MNYARAIRILREYRKMTMAELGEAVGRSERTIESYESGERVPTTSCLGQISISLQIPVGVIAFMAAEKEDIEQTDIPLSLFFLKMAREKFRKVAEQLPQIREIS